MNISDSLINLIGNTPLVRLSRITRDISAQIYVKLEYFNPFGSSKDRLARAMIEDGEKKGLITGDTVIIEPTSGNTGIALAGICAVKGYRLILTMPENMPAERAALLKYFGAELVLTTAQGGMQAAVEKARELAASFRSAYIPDQFNNPVNPRVHYETTAEEIWRDTEGNVDVLVAGIGTGGTISGTAGKLKEKKSGVYAVGVEPAASAVLSGGEANIHAIPGIGAGFIPSVLDRSVIDEVIAVKDEEARTMSLRLAKEEGISAGISGGAALAAAMNIAERKEFQGKSLTVILPDSGERYLSMLKE